MKNELIRHKEQQENELFKAYDIRVPLGLS
jgi:hypothetical protein